MPLLSSPFGFEDVLRVEEGRLVYAAELPDYDTQVEATESQDEYAEQKEDVPQTPDVNNLEDPEQVGDYCQKLCEQAADGAREFATSCLKELRAQVENTKSFIEADDSSGELKGKFEAVIDDAKTSIAYLEGLISPQESNEEEGEVSKNDVDADNDEETESYGESDVDALLNDIQSRFENSEFGDPESGTEDLVQEINALLEENPEYQSYVVQRVSDLGVLEWQGSEYALDTNDEGAYVLQKIVEAGVDAQMLEGAEKDTEQATEKESNDEKVDTSEEATEQDSDEKSEAPQDKQEAKEGKEGPITDNELQTAVAAVQEPFMKEQLDALKKKDPEAYEKTNAEIQEALLGLQGFELAEGVEMKDFLNNPSAEQLVRGSEIGPLLHAVNLIQITFDLYRGKTESTEKKEDDTDKSDMSKEQLINMMKQALQKFGVVDIRLEKEGETEYAEIEFKDEETAKKQHEQLQEIFGDKITVDGKIIRVDSDNIAEASEKLQSSENSVDDAGETQQSSERERSEQDVSPRQAESAQSNNEKNRTIPEKNLEKRIQKYRQDPEHVRQSIQDAANTIIEQIHDEIRETATNQRSYREEIRSLRTERNSLQAQVDVIEDQLSRNDNEAQDSILERKLKRLERNLDDVRTEIDALEDEREDLAEKREGLQDESDALLERVKDTYAKANNANDALRAARNAVTNANELQQSVLSGMAFTPRGDFEVHLALSKDAMQSFAKLAGVELGSNGKVTVRGITLEERDGMYYADQDKLSVVMQEVMKQTDAEKEK